MRPVMLALSCWSASCAAPCEELARIRPDSEAINGVSLEQANDLLLAVDNTLPLRWDNGEVTMLYAEITPALGTAHLDQRADCVAECDTNYHLLMECGPDELGFGATFRVRTEDGRLDEVLLGDVTAHRGADGAVLWGTYSDVPVAELNGSAVPASIQPSACDIDQRASRDHRLIVWLSGTNDSLDGAVLGFSATTRSGGGAATCTTGLATSEVEGE